MIAALYVEADPRRMTPLPIRQLPEDYNRLWANAGLAVTALPMNRANLRCLGPAGGYRISRGKEDRSG